MSTLWESTIVSDDLGRPWRRIEVARRESAKESTTCGYLRRTYTLRRIHEGFFLHLSRGALKFAEPRFLRFGGCSIRNIIGRAAFPGEAKGENRTTRSGNGGSLHYRPWVASLLPTNRAQICTHMYTHKSSVLSRAFFCDNAFRIACTIPFRLCI